MFEQLEKTNHDLERGNTPFVLKRNANERESLVLREEIASCPKHLHIYRVDD